MPDQKWRAPYRIGDDGDAVSLQGAAVGLLYNTRWLHLLIALGGLVLIYLSGPADTAAMMNGPSWWIVALVAAIVILVAVAQWFFANLYSGWARGLARLTFSIAPVAALASLLLVWAA